MCYVVLVSTTSSEDLSRQNCDAFSFEAAPPRDDWKEWKVYSRGGGCSCNFRHLMPAAPGEGFFSEPEAWFEEDAETVADTGLLYDALATLVQDGHAVEIVATWESAWHEDLGTMEVKLSEIGRDQFRFWEGRRFSLVAS